MNTRYALLSAALTIALTLPALGQDAQKDRAIGDMKPRDMSTTMGKPTFVATVEGLHIKVWLMSQTQHKEMMKPRPGLMMMHGEKDTTMATGNEMQGMKHEGMEMDKSTKETMMAGTHHIGVEVTDTAKGTQIADASVNLVIESPSKKNSSVDLKPMMSHFGSGLTLDEKGEYRFTVNVTVGGLSRTTKFQYTVD